MFKILLHIYLGLIALTIASSSAESHSFNQNNQGTKILDQLMSDFAAMNRQDFREPSLSSSTAALLDQQEEGDNYRVALEVINQKGPLPEKTNPNFNKKDLISFIVEQKGIDKRQFDGRRLISSEHLKTIETLVNLHLESLQRDLQDAFIKNNTHGYVNLSKMEILTARHKNNIQTIADSVTNSPNDNGIRDLIFCYYSSSISDLLYSYCKPRAEDAKEMWEKKSTIFTVNIKMHLNQYTTLFSTDTRSSILVQAIQKILEPNLLSFYEDSCEYIKHLYEHNRSILTKGLKWIGARDSDTEKKFIHFVQQYRLHFPFLEKISTDTQENVREHFSRVDRTFVEGVSTLGSLLSWQSPPSSDKKSSASPSWSGWW
ncbi:hypothetical protein [Candidatus Odyssella acanthamoebae]|uniref:Uncharacterized protein n=1 Tax=Candidatus Odyssella acanthamoebae TaxID=91604 RepID=A0A077AQP8_9PROT|nr:hypothetical protein [Candidatus Paracaedibacter acanthamoebae]AIK95497.1 hypothetical protein ID47_00080 [Candidatus Paracaedibacter acanthamoebae]